MPAPTTTKRKKNRSGRHSVSRVSTLIGGGTGKPKIATAGSTSESSGGGGAVRPRATEIPTTAVPPSASTTARRRESQRREVCPSEPWGVHRRRWSARGQV